MTQAFIGAELLVNTTTASDQEFPQITTLSDGGCVVTWGSTEGAAGGHDIRGRIHVAYGTAVGDDFLMFSRHLRCNVRRRRSRPRRRDEDINHGSTAMTTTVDRHRSDFNFSSSGSIGSFGDILWRDHAGNDVLWLMNINSPSSVAALPFVTPDWHVKAAAEFDVVGGGAGSSDILWQNDNGALAFWQMNGTTLSASSALPNPGPAWHVVGRQ